VRDATTHEPLADVAIFLKGENRSATTDAAGCFSIPLPAQRPRTGRALVLHYTGYQSKTVAVPATSAATMQLELLADPAAAGAIIVGYEVQHRQDITGSAAGRTAGAAGTLVLAAHYAAFWALTSWLVASRLAMCLLLAGPPAGVGYCQP
jgi:hypothetical protein